MRAFLVLLGIGLALVAPLSVAQVQPTITIHMPPLDAPLTPESPDGVLEGVATYHLELPRAERIEVKLAVEAPEWAVATITPEAAVFDADMGPPGPRSIAFEVHVQARPGMTVSTLDALRVIATTSSTPTIRAEESVAVSPLLFQVAPVCDLLHPLAGLDDDPRLLYQEGRTIPGAGAWASAASVAAAAAALGVIARRRI